MPISWKEMCKLFRREGYEIVAGGKGSHIKMARPGYPTVTIPHHRELSIGIEHSLRKRLLEVQERNRR